MRVIMQTHLNMKLVQKVAYVFDFYQDCELGLVFNSWWMQTFLVEE